MGKVNTARGDCAGNCVNMNWRNIGRKNKLCRLKKRSGGLKLWFMSRRTWWVPARGRKRKANWTCLNSLSISFCCNPGDPFHFWSMILNSEESWLFVKRFSWSHWVCALWALASWVIPANRFLSWFLRLHSLSKYNGIPRGVAFLYKSAYTASVMAWGRVDFIKGLEAIWVISTSRL